MQIFDWLRNSRLDPQILFVFDSGTNTFGLWQQAIPALFGGVMALAGVYLSNAANKDSLERQIQSQRDERNSEVIRRSGEELYILISRWAIFAFTSHIVLYSVMKGTASYNEHLDHMLKSDPGDKIDPARVEFIIHAYFPELTGTYNGVQSALRVHNSVVHAFEQAYKAGKPGKEFIPQFQAAQIDFEKLIDALKLELVDLVKKKGAV